MEIRINIPDELASQAQARGVSVEAYIEHLLSREAQQATVIAPGEKRLQTPEQIRNWLDALAQFSDKIPPLPDTISREWIYQDHD